MALSRRQSRSRFTLLFLILLSATVMTLDFRGEGDGLFDAVRNGAADALAPVREAANDALSPVSDAFSGVTGYGDLEAENAELRARLAELEGAQLRSAEAERELRALQELLDVDWVGSIPTVGARVVTTPVSNYEQTIELDKGTDDGVDEGMPVVTGSGLAGQVVSASGSRATVRLITDPDSRIAVRLRTSGDLGLVTGEGPGDALSVEFIEPGTAVSAAELLLTSGLEGAVLPGGIPVGRVVQRAEGDLEQSVDIRPVADLEHLELVRVLQWTPPPAS